MCKRGEQKRVDKGWLMVKSCRTRIARVGGDGWREEMVVLLVQCSKRAVEVVASQSAAASVVGMEW